MGKLTCLSCCLSTIKEIYLVPLVSVEYLVDDMKSYAGKPNSVSRYKIVYVHIVFAGGIQMYGSCTVLNYGSD